MATKFWRIYGILILSLILPVTAAAGTPTERTRITVDKVINILKDPALQPESKKSERRTRLRAAIQPRFDFPEMAKRTLGSHWSRLTAQEQQEFVRLFSDLLESTYVEKIESYKGEAIVYTGEKQDKDHAQVMTNVVTTKGEDFSINYNLRHVDGDWKVYDIIVENISLINNYRAQFNRVLETAGHDQLLRKLRKKI